MPQSIITMSLQRIVDAISSARGPMGALGWCNLYLSIEALTSFHGWNMAMIKTWEACNEQERAAWEAASK